MRGIGRLALTFVFLCALPFVGSARDRALVVGVNSYPGILEGGRAHLHDLSGAVFDAKTFESLLKEQFNVAAADIRVLTDSAATREAILRDFQSWLIDGTRSGDRVFFYFAGHGVSLSVKDEETGGTRLTSAIAPADARGELVTGPIDGLIPGTEIRALLEQLGGRRVTVVADSCHSGSVSRGVQPALSATFRARTLTPGPPLGMTEQQFEADRPMRLRAKLNGRLLEIEPTAPDAQAGGDLAVWAAAKLGQVTFDLNTGNGGIFTQSFASGLRKKAPRDDAGEVTAVSLLNFVQDEAKQFCKEAGAACSAGLTPQLLSKNGYLTAPILGGNPSLFPDKREEPQGAALASKMEAILSHHNDFALDVAMQPGTTLKLGDSIRLRVLSGESGKVAVFDASPDGNITQIFPNAKSGKDGRIQANAPLLMPDAYWGIQFKATPPAGKGSLLVLVAEDGMDLNKATDRSLDLKPIKATSRLLEIIATEAAKPINTPVLEEPTRAARWAFKRIPYTIAP